VSPDRGQIPPPAETLESQGSEDVLSNEDLTEAAAAGMRWIAYARLAIEAMLFATMVLLARMIPPAAFGIFAVVTIVQELALMMPMEGVGGALVQRRSIERDHLRGGLALSTALSLLLAAATALIAIVAVEPLFGHQTEMLVLATTPYFLLGAIYALPMAVLRRRLDFRRLSIIDLALNSTRALATVALALAGLDASALVFGSMAGMAAAVCLALVFAPVPLPAWRPRAMRDLLPYGGPAALATISWTGFRNGDYAIVGSVLGPTQAGLYWRSYQLAVEYQGKIANAVAQIAFPVLARTEGIEALLVLRQRMVRLLAALVFPLLAILVVLAPVLIPWLFGEAWAPAVVPTQILVAGGAATLAINTCGSALMAAGRARALLGYGVAHFVVYAGSVLAVAHLGIAAVAIAGSVVHGLFLLVAYALLLRGREENAAVVLWHDLAPALTACAALVAVAVPANTALADLNPPVLVQMAGAALAGGVAYLVALRLLFPSSAHDLGAALARLLPARLSVGRRLGAAMPAES
jgi:O-antigen/teichoic acid export membrane protein